MNRRNPYKLFDYYTEADAQVFFGREQEISSVTGDILANKLLVLFARSGSGKTSLLNAGIGPALNDIGRIEDSDPGIAMVTVRLSADISPEQAALNALKETLAIALPGSTATLYEALQHLCGPEAENHANGNYLRGVVLVFDQFEELFISLFKDRPDIRKQFAENLAKIIHDTSMRAYVVLSLRSDHFHHLNEFRNVIPSIFQNNTNLELRPFDDEAALRVILGPSDLPESGFSWETGLPERIVAEMKQLNDDNDGVLPIHLQIICHGLWENLNLGETKICRRHYESFLQQSGNKGTLITPAQAMIASRIIHPLEAYTGKQKRDLVQLLSELVTQHRTKSVRSFDELAAVIPAERLRPLLSDLEQKLLLRVESGQEKTWYELRHDYLALVIDPWLTRQKRNFERKDLLSRFLIAFCLIASASLCTKLWYDWHSYYAEIGSKDHEDELVIKRRPVFGLWEPEFWRLELMTGFHRNQLQASRVPHFHFDVPDAMTDWKDIEPHLLEQATWQLQLAVNAKEFGSVKAIDNNQNEIAKLLSKFQFEKESDIDLFSAADARIMEFIRFKLQKGDSKTKLNIIRLCVPARVLSTQKRQQIIKIPDLLNALNDSSTDVKLYSAVCLAPLTKELGREQIQTIINLLKDVLKSKDKDVSNSTFDGSESSFDRYKRTALETVNNLIEVLDSEQAKEILEMLRVALRDSDDTVKRLAITSFGKLTNKLDSSHVKIATDELINPLAKKPTDDYIDVITDGLQRELDENINAYLFQAFITELMNIIKNNSSDEVRIAAIASLGRLSDYLNFEQKQIIIHELWPLIKLSNIKIISETASTIGNFAESIKPEKLWDTIKVFNTKFIDSYSHSGNEFIEYQNEMNFDSAIEKLVKALTEDKKLDALDELRVKLKDKNQNTRLAATLSLGYLAQNLDAKKFPVAIEGLMIALKDSNLRVSLRASQTLITLAKQLEAEQVRAVIIQIITNIKHSDADVSRAAHNPLSNLHSDLVGAHTQTAIDELIIALNDKDTNIKRAAIEALGAFAEDLADRHAKLIKPELMNLLGDSNLRYRAIELLCILAEFLDKKQTIAILDKVWTGLQDQDEKIRSSSSDNLGILAIALDKEQARDTLEKLLRKPKNFVSTNTLLSLAISSENADTAGSLLLSLEGVHSKNIDVDDYMVSSESDEHERYDYLADDDFWLLRELVKGDWRIGDDTLTQWLSSDDSKKRIFAAYVLAQHTLDAETLSKIKLLRDDPKNRPWVKMAALRCLMEIEREKQAVIFEQQLNAKKEAESHSVDGD